MLWTYDNTSCALLPQLTVLSNIADANLHSPRLAAKCQCEHCAAKKAHSVDLEKAKEEAQKAEYDDVCMACAAKCACARASVVYYDFVMV